MYTAMDNWRFVLLQLCDSGFPSGAFSHSFGFETYVQEGRIHDKQTFRAWLEAYLMRQWIYQDGFALRLAHEALDDAPAALDRLRELDRRMTVQTIPYESRSGAVRMGRRMLELVRKLWPDTQGFAEYGRLIENARCQGQVAIVFAIVCRSIGVPLREALLHFAYACSVPLVQNGVRAIPLGQSDGQLLLVELHAVWEESADAVMAMHPDLFGISPPGLELAAIRHEWLDGRMFMS